LNVGVDVVRFREEGVESEDQITVALEQLHHPDYHSIRINAKKQITMLT
jgi:hypothetical protein